MTNAIKKRLNRKGFTLAEVLVTVAIILILTGVTFVSVAQYQKNLRLMEMDGTAKEIFIAAQNHLSVAQASGDLERLAEKAKSATGTTDSTIGTKLDAGAVSAYAGNIDGEYYSVIHNVASGNESYTPADSDAILQMMLPFGALDETVATGGNYAIVYELKSASVVAVLYSGAGNASFGNAAVINFSDEDVKAIPTLYNDKAKRKSYEKNGVTAIVGCYTGTAGSAAIPTETLEAPKLEVKNENKLHVLVRGNYSEKDVLTLTIHGVQSNTTAIMQLNCTNGANKFDITLDDITSENTRFTRILSSGRFTRSNETSGTAFIPGENIEISATARATDALATPKTSAVYTTSSLFADANDGRTVYIKNLRHLENLSVDMSDFAGNLTDKSGTTNGDVTAIQKNDITMLSWDGLEFASYLYGAGTLKDTYVAVNVKYPLSYDGGRHEIYGLSIAPYLRSNDRATHNAGIFGNVTANLSVKNLILRNDKIPADASGGKPLATNAGMLLGKTSANLTVDGVLAYYHEAEYDEAKDSAVEVQASEVAGGLIGLVTGGKLDVRNSAAAVYAKGGNAAGGLIGSVSDAEAGSTIVQSYAGGHTKDGAYSTTDAATSLPVLTGAGRYNVQASGYAGGFIGVTTDKVSMNAVYSTASAYSTDVNKSGSFSGNTETNFGTAKNYYAIGPHNGTDASADDTAKAEIKTGQVRRQATPYDRKLLVKDTETEHKTMDKTSYPLCTVRNLCEEDTSIKDTDLPWFIKEHVGDWVLLKESGKAGFEIENGNRLTVRIHTGLATITQPLLYKIKVHGESSNQDIYFNVEVKSDNTVTVKRENSDGNLVDISEIAECITLDGTQAVQFYLDDITRENGHFYTVCARLLCPGEDITVNVAPAEKSVVNNSVKYIADFKNENQLRTNSLFGYLEKSEKGVIDEHNSQKIKAVKTYYPTAGNENGLGLIPVRDENGNESYYVQIDNSRHLENLSSPVGYYSKQDIGQKITGAVQTDNIYWTGWDKNNTKDTFTEGFIEELGQNNPVNVYNDKGENVLSTDNHFSPISLNESLKMYDGAGYKISGLDAVEQNGYAALFTKIVSAATIKNLVLENASFKSESQYTAGLIAHAGAAVDIDKVKFTGHLNINGRNTTAGFVANAANSITIDDSGIENGNIKSTNEMSAGLVAYAGQTALISNVKCTGILNVSGYSETGGFVSSARNSITVSSSCIEKGDICSTSGNAGGLIAYAGMDASLSDITVGNKDWNKEDSISTFHVQSNGHKSENASAGALIARAAGVSIIKNVHLNLNLAVENTSTDSFNAEQDAVGGLIGCACAKVFIDDSGIKNGTIMSIRTRTGGFIGFAQNEVSIKNSEFRNGVITSDGDRAGGLIAHASQVVTIDRVHCGNLMVTGQTTSGGFLGFSPSKVTIQNSEVNNCTVLSTTDRAGGLIATGTNATISNVNITGTVCVTSKQAAGGFCGYNTDQLSIAKSSIHSTVVNSTDTYSGGFIGYTGGAATINDSDLVSDSLITSKQKDAGGVIGHAKSDVNITNTTIRGLNTEIIAKKGNAGGLIGGFENSGLTIDNSAVSAFVNSENGNAGGLIGWMNNQASGTQISNSYYGGRTKAGAYSAVKVHEGTTNERSYEANIMARYSAGGLIGSIGDNPHLTISNCYSTGSVKTKEGSVGGFIGYIGRIDQYNKNMSLSQCYSMGKVLSDSNASDATQKTGGFIGRIAGAEPNCINESVFYLNAFNLSSMKAIGNSEKSTITEISNASKILGTVESSNLTSVENTTNYDETLDNQQYPYKNWTKSGDGTSDPITYYGDWPLPNKQLNGRIVYYYQLSGDKTGGEFTLTGYDTSLTTTLHNPKGNFETDGFGIICETPTRKDANKKFWYSYSLHDSSAKDDGYTMLSPEGSDNNVECSEFVLEGKTYYFFRLTNIDFKKLKNTTIYFKGADDTIYAKIIYKATINKEAHTVTFDRVE